MQLRVAAYDSANPAQKIFTEILFPVRRNEFAPEFAKNLYQKEVSENFPIGVAILTVSASDRDKVSERVCYIMHQT